MTSRSREPEAETTAPVVAQLRTTPEKYVFTEDGNSEGWIATDSVVSVDR
jgi:hypothetical protein